MSSLPLTAISKKVLLVLSQIVGWTAALIGASVALPQVFRLLKTRSTAGLSVFVWQAALGTNLAWLAHGVLLGHLNLVVPNLIFGACTITILLQFRRDRGARLLPLFAPGLVLGTITAVFDLAVGPIAFAVAAALPSVIAQLLQLHGLILRPNIRGISVPYLTLNVSNQGLWLVWSLLVNDLAATLAGVAVGTLMALNLVYALLRRFRVVRARLAVMSA